MLTPSMLPTAQAEIALSFLTGYYEDGGMYVDDLSSVGAAPSVLQMQRARAFR